MSPFKPSAIPLWKVLAMISGMHATFYWHITVANHCDDPNPVTDLEVTMTSYKQFGLTWTPPSNEVQDCIHAYNLTVTSDDRGLVCTYSLWRGYYFNDNIYPCVTTICTNYTATIYVVSYPGISRSTSITFYTGPAKARRLQASNTTRTETYLTWKSPDTMACAKHFKLYHCAYDGPAEQDCVYQTKTFSLNRTSYKLGGLQPCKDNYIWLATVDKYGGENNVSIVVHTGDGHPPKIRGLMSPVNKGYSVTVSWLAAESFNPHCHAGYRVCSSSDRDGSENCYFTSKTTLVVKELTPCTNYTIHVQTVDGELKQYSHFSAAFSLRVFTNPGIPTTTLLPDTAARWAKMEFERPDNLSASCLRHYEMVECVERSWTGVCQELRRDVLPANTTSYNSSEFTGCAISHLIFHAVGENGASSYLDLKFINQQGDLQPLTNLSVLSATTKQLALAWTPPEFNECPHAYRVCWRLYNYKICATSFKESGDIFDNLSLFACHKYNVRVFLTSKKFSSASINVTFHVGPANVGHQSVELTSNSALVTWWRDTTQHLCSAGYRVTWCPESIFSNTCGPSPTGSVTLGSGFSSYSITGLETCVQYLLVFETLGGDGFPASEPNTTVIRPPIEKIGAITDLTIHQWNNSTVTLDIVFPNNTTKCITEFTTCLYETDNEDTEKYCRFMRTEWINRTQSCTNYTLDITAISYDKQTTNGSITFVTGAAQVSDVIPNVSPSGKAVTVTWTFPESNVRCVSYHVVSFIRAEDNLVLIRRNVSKEGTRSSYGGLFFCNSYKVEVQPITLDDESPPAVTALFHTPSNVRSLTGLSVTGIKSDALHVSYTIAETSSNCVHHFQICWEARGVNKSCTNEQGYSSSSVNITGLTPATNYTVEVTPVAPDGQKYVTSTVSGCTLPSNVTMVTDVTVAVHEGGRSVRVSWTIPQKDVESAGEWLITCSRLKDDVAVLEKAVSWTTTSLAIGNLETCVSYSANVQLVNSDLSSTDEASVPFITSGKDGHC